MKQDPFKEYLRQTEPDIREKGYIWQTAVGLQAVDGLTPSNYLISAALQNIEGKISLDETQRLLDSYYEENPQTEEKNDRTEEADKVSVRIARLLSENAFSFTPNEYLSIHKKLFTGIYKHAGKFRDYNITKKEWVLDGETVLYGSASELRATLEYDLQQEKSYNYKGLSLYEIIHHLAVFISRLWQIHAFGEGNTRTTAVFFIKYLRTLGFQATNDIFAKNAWYFRNALVRANYNNLQKGIHETTEFLELFLKNLLLNEHHKLHNRAMHVSGMFTQDINPNIHTPKANIATEKANIAAEKANIAAEKASPPLPILTMDKLSCFSPKVMGHIRKMYAAFGNSTVFGRSDVQAVTGLKPTRASELLKELAMKKVIISINGQGKGKYRFIE